MDIFQVDENSTPLTPEEKIGLKLKWITLRAELNEAEARNISQAMIWLSRQRNKDKLSLPFLLNLHKKMFCDVWVWAGKYRTTEKNIGGGVPPYLIPDQLANLFDNLKFWIENKTYCNLEIAARFHHKLVHIHPFPNGNGRVARVMADLVYEKLEGRPLCWGSTDLTHASHLRDRYIDALREADRGDYMKLLQFLKDQLDQREKSI